jgi:hypothetical protein
MPDRKTDDQTHPADGSRSLAGSGPASACGTVLNCGVLRAHADMRAPRERETLETKDSVWPAVACRQPAETWARLNGYSKGS